MVQYSTYDMDTFLKCVKCGIGHNVFGHMNRVCYKRNIVFSVQNESMRNAQ